MANGTKIPSFLNKVHKQRDKMPTVSGQSKYPDFFFDSGSCIVNKVMSDRYDGGYAQGRMAMLAGLSNTGKSFLAGNAIRQAQKDGYGTFIIDSENALDDVWLSAVGVDVDSPTYGFAGVETIDDATKMLATFFNEYLKAPEKERIPYLIVVDSLDEMQTKNQKQKTDKGETVGDMGQQVKQLKKFQSNIMHRIKTLPMAAICTKQPYLNQDGYTNKREPTIITPALRFAYSQIALLTNKLMKDNTTDTFEGILLDVFGHKTRFAKPFQKCTIEVPYESGMDWYSGVLEAADAMGIVSKPKGSSWYTFGDTKFQKNSFDDHKQAIFTELKKTESSKLEYLDDDEKAELEKRTDSGE